MAVMKTGIQSFFYALVRPLRLFAPAHHDFDAWLDRFKQEFDPKGLSNPGQPYIIDRIVSEMYPGAITDELKATIAEVAAGPWRGNDF